MKPDNPIVYNEFYLDAMTGGSSELPAPVTPEQHYLAYLAGMTVTLPQPVILRDMFLAKICGMDVDVPTYIPGEFPRKFAYYAKAAGQDVDVPQPITRAEMYWFDYVSKQPSEKEYTGAVPVTFTANGQPLLDYLISGNTVQSGTPSPTTPIQPQGTGERTTNLAWTGWAQDFVTRISNTTNAIIVSDEDRTALRVGVGAGYGDYDNKYIFKTDFKPNTQYTFSFYGKRPSAQSLNPVMCIQYTDNTVTDFTPENDGNYNYYTIISEPNKTIKYLRAKYTNGNLYIDIDTFMVNEGSTALPYEPYGIKIPILNNSQTTNVYLGEVQTTRKIKKLVLTGNETVAGSAVTGGWIITNLSDSINNTTELQTSYCSHYVAKNNGAMSSLSQGEMCISTQVNNRINFVTTFATAEDFKAYLAQQYAAGTPVTVWYVLAEPETGVVNEPLRKIGDYADTVSMEQAGVEIPTARGTNTLDVLTDVKPSEIYIKYKE